MPDVRSCPLYRPGDVNASTLYPGGLPLVRGRSPRTASDESVLEAPLVGAVAAGKPVTAVENLDGYVALDKAIFKGEGLFALRIRGDSMAGIGILDGDIVVVRQKTTAENGEVVVVLIDGEATLKRFFSHDRKIVLRAENPACADIVASSAQDVQIAGKLVGVIRKY